jgi:nucleotide-binding universal stress UspA family protein
MAEKFNAKLHLIHVVDESVDVTGFYIPHASVEAEEANMVETAKKALAKLCKLKLGGFAEYETKVLEGVPHKEIVKYLKENGIDLLIMGTHNKKGIEQLLLGSTTKSVYKEVSCPVLTVLPPDEVVDNEQQINT